MTASVAQFSHQAAEASARHVSFDARQRVASAQLEVEATIRRRGARSVAVEYGVYRSPWLALEELMYGQAELTGDELCRVSLHAEGLFTWIHDPSTHTSLRKMGHQLFEPIPGLSALGEVSFVSSLAQDFLLRDLGVKTRNGRTVRRLALKPKQRYRSHLLSTVTYPFERALIDFDLDTYFPLFISLVPSPGTPASTILGPNESIEIEYHDVRFPSEAPPAAEPFVPPTDGRTFLESVVAVQDLGSQVPFSAALEPLKEQGFDASGEPVLLTLDAAHARAFARASFTSASEEDDALQPHIALTVGNYMARDMARRRTTLSEKGTARTRAGHGFRILERKMLWEEQAPKLDRAYAPVDVFFEVDGVFWFLSGVHVELDTLESLAVSLLDAQSPGT